MTEHAVKLDSLPAGLEFPPELASRICFDAAQHRLVYCGFMYKAHYDRLMRLDSSVEYRRAIQRLFQCSTDVETPQLRRFAWILAVLIAACLLLAGLVWWQLTRPTPGLGPSSAQAMYRRMGLDDGIASDPEDYVRRAVRLATDRDFRDGVRASLAEASGALFEDQAVVRAHEEAFRRLIAEARQSRL